MQFNTISFELRPSLYAYNEAPKLNKNCSHCLMQLHEIFM